MRTWLLLGLLAGLGLGVGCQSVTQTPKENYLAARQVGELEMRELIDDIDMIAMIDHQNRLTKWRTR